MSPHSWTKTQEREKYMSKEGPTSAIGGLVLSILGAMVILIDAIAYLMVGNGLAGILGIVFVILILIFAFMAFFTKGQVELISAMLVFIVGFIVMIAAGSLLADIIAILAALVVVFGGILLFPRKPTSK
jgi:hypothetical protein